MRAAQQSSRGFQRELFKWFSAALQAQQTALFRAGLERAGCFAESAEQFNDTVIFKEAIAGVQADQQLTPTVINNFAAYVKLIRQLVAVNAQGAPRRGQGRHQHLAARQHGATATLGGLWLCVKTMAAC